MAGMELAFPSSCSGIMALLSAALLPAFSCALSEQKKIAPANSFWGRYRSPPSLLSLHPMVSVEVRKSVWNGFSLAIPNCGIRNRLQGGSYKVFYIVLFIHAYLFALSLTNPKRQIYIACVDHFLMVCTPYKYTLLLYNHAKQDLIMCMHFSLFRGYILWRLDVESLVLI